MKFSFPALPYKKNRENPQFAAVSASAIRACSVGKDAMQSPGHPKPAANSYKAKGIWDLGTSRVVRTRNFCHLGLRLSV
jgi:hypothetical protein